VSATQGCFECVSEQLNYMLQLSFPLWFGNFFLRQFEGRVENQPWIEIAIYISSNREISRDWLSIETVGLDWFLSWAHLNITVLTLRNMPIALLWSYRVSSSRFDASNTLQMKPKTFILLNWSTLFSTIKQISWSCETVDRLKHKTIKTYAWTRNRLIADNCGCRLV